MEVMRFEQGPKLSEVSREKRVLNEIYTCISQWLVIAHSPLHNCGHLVYGGVLCKLWTVCIRNLSG